MNNIYLELDKNEYLVLEDNNKLSKVKSYEDIGEILSIENDIEELKNKINQKNKEITQIKAIIKSNKFLSKVLLGSGFGMAIIGLLTGVTQASFYIVMCLILPTLFKVFFATTLGFESKNLKEIHKLNMENIVIKGKLDALNIKLKKRLEKNNYYKYECANFETIDSVLEKNKSKEPTVKKLILKREP